MYKLELIQKVLQGTLSAKSKRDIQDAAHLLGRYADLHDDLAVIQALCDARIAQARDQGGKERERDAFWEALHIVASQSRYQSRADLHQWVLNWHENNPYSRFSDDEVKARSQELQNYKKIPGALPPIERSSNNSFFHDLYGIMEKSLEDLNEDYAVRAARLIVKHHPEELAAKIISNNKRLFGLRPHDIDFPEGREATYFERMLSLADKLDAELGTVGTRHEFVKAGLLKALHKDVPQAVQDFFIAQSSALPPRHKFDLLKAFSYLEWKEDKVEYPCRTVFRNHDDVFYIRDTDRLKRFLDVVASWDQKEMRDSRFVSSLVRQYFKKMDQYKEEGFVRRTFDRTTAIGEFVPELKWGEVQSRINLMMAHSPTGLKEVSWENDNYLGIAAARAIKYGHAGDLANVFVYCRSLTPVQKQDRKIEYNLPSDILGGYYARRISRDPETLAVLAKNLPDEAWLSTEDSQYDAPLIARILTCVSEREDHDRFDYAACSYISNGLPMDKSRRIEGYRVTLPLLERLVENMAPERRKELLDNIFSLDGRHGVLGQSIKTILEASDLEVPSLWVRTMHKLLPPDEFAKKIHELAETVTDKYSSASDVLVIGNMFKEISKLDRQLAAAALDKAGRWYKQQTVQVIKAVAGVGVVKDCEAEGDSNQLSPQVLGKVVEHISTYKGPVEQLILDCQQELGLRDKRVNPYYNKELYAQLLPVLQVVQSAENNKAAEENASKLANLFDTFRKADSFVRHHAMPGRQPLHDLCLYSLPYSQAQWNKEVWGNLAVKYGQAITHYLALAPSIEKYIEDFNQRRRSVNAALGKEGKYLGDRTLELKDMKPSMIRAIANKVGYARAMENREAADFCLRYGVGEEEFNKTLDLLGSFNVKAKKKDLMPALIVDGEDLGLQGYHLRKIPKGHLTNLWIGKMVNCCNYLGDHGSDMAVAQFEGPKNALYVINDSRNRPVAKMSGWLSSNGNLVFNAWERLSDEEDFLLTRFVLAAGIQALENNPKMQRVMLGTGPLDPKEVPFKKAGAPEVPAKNVANTADSQQQFTVVTRERLPEAKAQLEKLSRESISRGQVVIKLNWQKLRERGIEV